MTIRNILLSAICLLVSGLTAQAQNGLTAQAQDGLPLDKWDLSLGVHSNLSQATGPALSYLKEKTENSSEFSDDIIGYQNSFRSGIGGDIGARYNVNEKVFLGFGVSLAQMRMMPRLNSISFAGTDEEQTEELNLTHSLTYLSPKIEVGRRWKGFSWSGGLAMNILVAGRSRRHISAESQEFGFFGYGVGVPINWEGSVTYAEPFDLRNDKLVEDASTLGYVPITCSAFSELRIQPFSSTRGPYFKVAYQCGLNKYKESVSAFWDTFEPEEILSQEEATLASRWHSFSIGFGWVIL